MTVAYPTPFPGSVLIHSEQVGPGALYTKLGTLKLLSHNKLVHTPTRHLLYVSLRPCCFIFKLETSAFLSWQIDKFLIALFTRIVTLVRGYMGKGNAATERDPETNGRAHPSPVAF